MGDWFQEQALSGSLLLAVPVALVAGLVSFFSPCVIPLLPGYLSYTTGLSGADLGAARHGRLLARRVERPAGVRARCPDDPARPGLRGLAAVHAARVAGPPGARGRA